jgi:hypothetical protein
MMKILFKNEFTICVLGALLFIPFLGNVHLFDWDEVNFAECAREMLLTKDLKKRKKRRLKRIFNWLKKRVLH